MKILIATIKTWNIENAIKFQETKGDDIEVSLITDKVNLTYENVKKFNPNYIFFPHWSWYIPRTIYEEFNCVVFHMTDLPFGRGGSPLQNLITRDIKNTKISALKVDGGIDTGDIYSKKDLSLNGTADEIFIRSSRIIFNEMIPEIIEKNPIPKPQAGNVVEFKRRTPEQGEIKDNFSMGKIYNYIRMLDGEGYSKAFIKFGRYRLEFSEASLKDDKIITKVEIRVGEEDEENISHSRPSR